MQFALFFFDWFCFLFHFALNFCCFQAAFQFLETIINFGQFIFVDQVSFRNFDCFWWVPPIIVTDFFNTFGVLNYVHSLGFVMTLRYSYCSASVPPPIYAVMNSLPLSHTMQHSLLGHEWVQTISWWPSKVLLSKSAFLCYL